MEPHFSRVTIVGVGLLGASLGLGLKARGMAGSIIGVGHRQSSLDVALDAGAIDTASMDAAEAAHNAEFIVIATPASLVIEKLDEVRGACLPSAVVTDVASTKTAICVHAAKTWPAPRRFIGSHPMAGSEKFGAGHGHPDFYQGSVCLVEQSDELDPEARDTVTRVWNALGARVLDVEPAPHDTLLARTSHLPHIVASAIAGVAGREGDIREVIGNGYRDTTRIAAGRPEIWRDICLTNRSAIGEELVELQSCIKAFGDALEAGDADRIEAFFARGKAARERAIEE